MRLKELRKQRKLKQIDVADVLNCSQGVYSRYESGEREPPFDIIKKMADYYGVTVDYLMGADTVEVPTPPPTPKKPDTIAEYLSQLNPENRAFIEEMARKLLASQEKK